MSKRKLEDYWKPVTQCPICDEWYDPKGERAKMHEHPEPQGGPERDAWIASGLSWEEYERAQSEASTDTPTLRDQFAMAALTGHIAHCSDTADDHVARWAYQQADAMLEARKAERDE